MRVLKDDEIAEMAARAAAAWPNLRVTHEALVTFLREKRDVQASPSPSAKSAKLHAEDLCLVLACLQGDAEAWRSFDRVLRTNVPGYVSRVDSSSAFADEIRQRLAEKLSVNADRSSKLTQYSGQGPLTAWLRVVALREAHSLRRGTKKELPADALALRATGADPELLLLKRRSAQLFERILREVLASLPERERMLLKLHHVDGLTLDAVAKVGGVSRATAARSLAQARERVLKRVERALEQDLGRNAPGAESLLALVHSQLELSIARHLATPPADD